MLAKYLMTAVLSLLLAAAPLQAQGAGDSLLVQVREAENGRPVKYACVTVIPKEGEVLFSKADAKGRVRFRNLTRGNYRVVVKADGFAAQKRQVEVGQQPASAREASGEAGAWRVEFELEPRGAGQRN